MRLFPRVEAKRRAGLPLADPTDATERDSENCRTPPAVPPEACWRAAIPPDCR